MRLMWMLLSFLIVCTLMAWFLVRIFTPSSPLSTAPAQTADQQLERIERQSDAYTRLLEKMQSKSGE